MITTTHPNNRYSISKFNKNLSVNTNDTINFGINNYTFKIFPKPGEIVLAGNFKVGYKDPNLKLNLGSDMVHIGEGVDPDSGSTTSAINAPHGSINYLENICKTKYRFMGWIPPTPPALNSTYSPFNLQVDAVTIEEVYSTTSNFPIYLKVEVGLNLPGIIQTFDKVTYSSLSIDLDFDLMQ